MEQRYLALEKSEEAARRRLAELDDLEERLRQEVEEQERQLAQERQDMETRRAKLPNPPLKREVSPKDYVGSQQSEACPAPG
jgi:hypothetical protein